MPRRGRIWCTHEIPILAVERATASLVPSFRDSDGRQFGQRQRTGRPGRCLAQSYKLVIQSTLPDARKNGPTGFRPAANSSDALTPRINTEAANVPNLVSELDRWRASQQFIEYYGGDVQMQAARHASQADKRCAALWLDVLAKIRSLQQGQSSGAFH